ncbi:SusD-like starch-binding protein associating with outer membrane [Cellulophaga sp. RHA19]|uniref:RagB/SusD family nutrient uptake outer membrane protein n=1 Tax=Cellulophaga sp. RHA19 TaxID=1798237 RepID=UPI000C2C10C4|nr:RagB/SusD family nutrient uptake outer membrane protein [Cellulophaga sp. RHA19]PKB43690.1 SusD-like starch-binding protein associating with outer membrane [Cellulophaga sp. RHA19]
MKLKYSVLILVLVLISACNKEEWLDIKPKGQVIPTNVSDYRLLLDQVDRNGEGFPKISPGFGVTYANTDLMSDDFTINDNILNQFSPQAIREYTWDNDLYLPNEEDGDWATLYGQIYPANIVIDEIMSAENGSELEKLEILAEAKIQRAFSYFALVNMYGLHYNENAASNPGVPMRLDSNLEGTDLSRKSVQEVYNLIIEDVESSLPYLPDLPESNNHKHRPSKSSAYAFLARVYLYMAEYDKALKAANSSYAIYNAINNYNDYGFYFDVLYLDQPQNDKQLLWVKGSPNQYDLLIASDELFSMYQDDDLRKTMFSPISFFFGIPEDGYVLGASFFTNYRGSGFTVPEVLLIRAECNTRLNNLDLALADINLIRENRFKTGTYTPLVSTDKTEVLNIVKNERRMELAGASLRLFDLKRYNEFDNANISLSRNLNGQTYSLQANGNNWALPIARKYINATPEIGENIRD